MDQVEFCVSQGQTLLLENLSEEIDPVLDPLLGRNLIKKGKAIKLGDKEVEYDSKFQLYLHTKLANPHYKPELQAQTTLINFTVTKQGNIFFMICITIKGTFRVLNHCTQGV